MDPIGKGGEEPQPAAKGSIDTPDQQPKCPIASNGNGVGEAHLEPPLERDERGQAQQAGSAAQGLLVGGEAAGTSAISTTGLVANGAADLLQASREEHKWQQRREKRQQQPQQQPQQEQHKTLRQLLEPPSVQNAPPGQHINGQSQQSQSLQGEQQQQQQHNWGLLHQKLQHGANLGLPPNQLHRPQHHPHLPYGAQPYSGVPAQVAQGGHPSQGGMMAMAQRQAQAYALAQGLQPPALSASTVPQPPPSARVAGEAIDLTDDTATPAAPQAQSTAPVQGASAASTQQDWQAYQAYKQRLQQHNAQQQFQFLKQQQQQPQQQQHHHHHQTGAGVHAHLQHMQMLQNGAAAGAAAGAAVGGAAQGVVGMSFLDQAHHRKLPDYVNGQAGTKRPRYEERPRYEADENQAGTVTFSLISTSFFTAKIRKPTPAAVHTFFKLTPGATYDEKERRWKFPLGAHENLAGALSRQGVQVVPVPRQALAAATLAVGPEGADADGKKEASVKLCDKMVPESIRKHLAPFQKQGVEFVLKKEGRAMIADEMGLGKTIQAISCAAAYESEWPLLIICPSSARYHWEHELLKWLDEDSITKKQITVVCKGKQDLSRGVTKVVIMSYELVNRMREELDLFNFGVVVCDECHYLKNQRAARTKAIVPLATKARRAILLSGTPALSRPSELFTQLNLLSASTWASFRDFGKRYCSGKKGRGTKGKFGADFSGASHIAELHALLRATVMVRRLKKNILKHLPPKQRSLVEVYVEDEAARRELQEDLTLLATRHHARLGRLAREHADKPTETDKRGASPSQATEPTPSSDAPTPTVRPRTPKASATPTDAPKGKGHGRQPKIAPGAGRVTRLSSLPPVSVVTDASPATTEANRSIDANGGPVEKTNTSGPGRDGRDVADMTKTELAQERRSLLMKLFADTGTAKIPAVIRHVSDILADEMTGGKVLVFAHHRNVLDALEQSVVRTGRVEYIRIDGRTKPKDRQDLVDTFQSNPSVRIALLGLTAAGIGITLTAASRVVFAELYWTPAQLLQAEDRCHRIGQATAVKVQYLVAKGSLDDALWPLIQEKIKLLGEMVEGEGETNQMEVKSPESKKPKQLSPVVSPGASASGASASGTIETKVMGSDATSKTSPAGEANGSDPSLEKTRAAFQGLQASVLENAQELAVEDMRHELDDEGRREFFEEQGEDGDGGVGDSDGGYSSGYSDGGGGQDGRDNMVCDLADSDGEEDNMVCDIADAESDGDVGVDVGGWSAAGPRSWHQESSASVVEPMGLEAALAKAKAATGDSNCVASKGSPEDVIDLLSGDEGQGAGVVDMSPDRPSPPSRSPSVEPIKATSELDGAANDKPVEISDVPVTAQGEQ
eukprot:g9618.t2